MLACTWLVLLFVIEEGYSKSRDEHVLVHGKADEVVEFHIPQQTRTGEVGVPPVRLPQEFEHLIGQTDNDGIAQHGHLQPGGRVQLLPEGPVDGVHLRRGGQDVGPALSIGGGHPDVVDAGIELVGGPERVADGLGLGLRRGSGGEGRICGRGDGEGGGAVGLVDAAAGGPGHGGRDDPQIVVGLVLQRAGEDVDLHVGSVEGQLPGLGAVLGVALGWDISTPEGVDLGLIRHANLVVQRSLGTAGRLLMNLHP